MELTSSAAARAFNLYPQKGAVAVGSDADIVLFDPNATTTVSAATHHSAVDVNIYEGRAFRGRVATTIARGVVVWDGARLTARRGAGRLLRPPTGGALFEGLDALQGTWDRAEFPGGTGAVARDTRPLPERRGGVLAGGGGGGGAGGGTGKDEL